MNHVPPGGTPGPKNEVVGVLLTLKGFPWYRHRVGRQSHICLSTEKKGDGTVCPSCAAGYERKLRYLVAFWDCSPEPSGPRLVINDLSPTAYDSLKKFVETYGEDVPSTVARFTNGDKGVLSVMPSPQREAKTLIKHYEEMPEGVIDGDGNLSEDVLEWALNYKPVEELRKWISEVLGVESIPNAEPANASPDTAKPTNSVPF